MENYENFEKDFLYRFKDNGIPYFDKNDKNDKNNKIIKKFYNFTKYLLSENEKYNLTAITDTGEIIVKHYIDSVIILKYFDIPEKSKIIDIGTGAGFPALPISIIRNDLNITFIDSSAKKINFLKKYATTKNYIFYNERAEELGKNKKIRETYDFAVLRAVAKINTICEIASPFLKPGGSLIVYKSKNPEIEISQAKKAMETLNLKIDEIFEFEIEENKRCLIKIKKLKNTPEKYPRNYSEILKSPL